MVKDGQRIYFCDELRGFAAFIVMLAHFTVGFNAFNGYLYNPKEGEIFPSWFIDLLPIDGAFGVAIFFLISGFVIPLSLSNRTSIKFIQARVIRIYPLYIISALISVLFIYIFNLYVGDFSDTFEIYLKSVTLFRDWIGGVAIDGVVWTLEIEMKFYLYVALFLFVLRRYPEYFVLAPAVVTIVCILLFKFDINYPLLGLSINTIIYNLGYITYMNIGVVLFLLYKNKFSIKKSIIIITFLFFVSLFFLYERYNVNFLVIKLYVLAFIIFIYLFKFRSDKKGIFSGFWANISYPLYAVHSTIGFSLLSFFTYKIRINIFVSLFLVIIIVIFYRGFFINI